MKRAILRLMPLLAAALAFGLVYGVGAQSTTYSTTLSGDNEVPAVSSMGSGSFTATLDGDSLDFTLTATGTGLNQAHIHLGGPAENGNPVVFLFGPADPPVDEINVSGSITVDDLILDLAGNFQGLVAALDAGNAYVNVHSAANPGGEIRGQIAAAAAAALPATGSGGLADLGGGSNPLLWALVAAGTTLVLMTAGRLALRRR